MTINTTTSTTNINININREDTLNRMPYCKALYKEDGFHILPDEIGIELEVMDIPEADTFTKRIDWSKTRFLRDGSMPNGGLLQLAPVKSVEDLNFITALNALINSKAAFQDCGCLVTLLFGDHTMIRIDINGALTSTVWKMVQEERYWREGVHKEDRVAWSNRKDCYIVC